MMQRRAARPAQVLIVTLVGVAAASLPSTLLSAVLPTIANDLRASTDTITWVQTAPSIAFAIGLPLFGKVGDLLGHRRVFISGFAAMSVTSLLTAASPNVWALIFARTANQLAGSATSTAAFGLLAYAYSETGSRARAFGLYASVLSISPVIAVVAGGPLVDAVGWQILFVFQSAFAAVSVLVAWPLLPETPRRPTFDFDLAGSLTLSAFVTALLFGVNRLRPWGIGHPAVWLSLTLVIPLVVLFVKVEQQVAKPLMPLRYFRHPLFSATVASNLFSQASFMGSFTLAPFMLARLFDYGPSTIARIVIVRPLFFALAAWCAGRFQVRLGLRIIQVGGNAVLCAGGLCGAWAAHERSLPLMLAALAIAGAGSGASRPGTTSAVTNAVEVSDVGIASGVNNLAQNAGSAVGVTALLGVVADQSGRHPFVVASLIAASWAFIGTIISWFIVSPRSVSGEPRPANAR